MYKVNEDNPEDGDWFWAKYTTDGKVGPVDNLAGCIGCHGIREKNYFIIVHEFD
ncbi:MAG: hypothetical protein K9L30_18365 [Desulfobacterales bacterium]|nr:hypothetical protein [Desulfobacterales bacterium]